MNVAGVLLAAGASSRMGTNKLLLDFAGTSLLRRSALVALDAGLGPLVVVVGHESERASGQVADLRCKVVENARYREGMFTSVIAGVAALPAAVDAAVVVLADMPLVSAGMIRAVTSRWHGEPMVLSLYGEVIAPPILYARSVFPELLALDRDGKQLVERHRAGGAEVLQPRESLQDLDEPADLERLLRATSGTR